MKVQRNELINIVSIVVFKYVSLQVQASDSDCGVNAMVNYTFAPETSTNEKFTIHSDTGDICVKAVLDREVTAYYELAIVATDRGT